MPRGGRGGRGGGGRGGGRGGKKTKRKHGQYYDIFDAAHEKLKEKVDEKAKAVSSAEHDIRVQENTKVDKMSVANVTQEDMVEEEMYQPAYESLLGSLGIEPTLNANQSKKRLTLKKVLLLVSIMTLLCPDSFWLSAKSYRNSD